MAYAVFFCKNSELFRIWRFFIQFSEVAKNSEVEEEKRYTVV